MSANRATPSEEGEHSWTTTHMDSSRYCGRDFVHCAEWMLLAYDASRSSTLANRLLVLLAMTRHRLVGTNQYHSGSSGRVKEGREAQPSAGVIDSQSVKTSEGGEERGVDVHKQVPGRKRHIIVDTLGLLLLVLVHRASIPDGNGGKLLLQKLFERIKHSLYNRWCRFKLIWADGAYEDIVGWVRQQFGWQLEVVHRPPDAKGFQILPRRWVVERTFGWLGRYRRLARDYEHQTLSSEAMVYLASIHRMLRLLDIQT